MKNEQLKFIIDSRFFRGTCITSMYDGIHSDYGGETLDELKVRENNPFLIAVSDNTINKMIRIYEKSLCGPFSEITEEDYYDSMDVLPPIRLKRNSFFVGEPYYGSLYPFRFTICGRYFKGLRSVRTPQAELERQMNEHYRNITFKSKITKELPSTITDKTKRETIISPYSFVHRDGKERFICNLVSEQNDAVNTRRARKDVVTILLSLRRHHFLYFSGSDKFDDMEKFMDMIEKKEYTLLANSDFIQYPVNRESVTFTGSIKETGETFFYRIYDRELFQHLLYKLRNVRREKAESKIGSNEHP